MVDIKERKEKIAAVVVTYNRKDLLKECLDSLLKQTRIPDSIIIVDNASTDGTEEALKNKYLKDSIFDYVKLKENTGGAGGFYTGIKRAYEKGFDWVWVMDDDVIATPDATEKYLKYKSLGKFIQGRRKVEGDDIFEWGQVFNPQTGRKSKLNEQELFQKKEFINVNVACFEGAFIHRDAIKKIGFPNRKFFIAEDDTLYGYCASRHFKILYIKDITLIRQRQTDYQLFLGKKIAKRSSFSLYYKIRNQFLLESEIKRIEKNLIVNHKPKIARETAKEFLKILLTQSNKRELSKFLFLAIKDGINKNFQPRQYFDYK